MKLYTIGFTKKSAQEFFTILKNNRVELLVDIRLHPGGQLSGFAKQEDLPYFLSNLANGCRYIHLPQLAPTPELLDAYRNSKDWSQYEINFNHLMDERHIPKSLDQALFSTNNSCLLCSEATPEKCHRRLVAERLAYAWPGMQVSHL